MISFLATYSLVVSIFEAYGNQPLIGEITEQGSPILARLIFFYFLGIGSQFPLREMTGLGSSILAEKFPFIVLQSILLAQELLNFRLAQNLFIYFNLTKVKQFI